MGIFDKVKHEIEHGLNSLGDGIKRDSRTGPGCISRMLNGCPDQGG